MMIDLVTTKQGVTISGMPITIAPRAPWATLTVSHAPGLGRVSPSFRLAERLCDDLQGHEMINTFAWALIYVRDWCDEAYESGCFDYSRDEYQERIDFREAFINALKVLSKCHNVAVTGDINSETVAAAFNGVSHGSDDPSKAWWVTFGEHKIVHQNDAFRLYVCIDEHYSLREIFKDVPSLADLVAMVQCY